MTLQELREMQSWSLWQKIDHAISVIETFINTTGKECYVSFSGGKDSTVLLDLIRRFINPNIKAVFCNTGNEYPEIVKFVRQTENVIIIKPKYTIEEILDKYGFPLISKEQSSYIHEARNAKSEKHLNKRLYGKQVGSSFKGKISERWKFLLKEKFRVSDKCCHYLKKEPFKRFEKETCMLPIIAIMADESDMRQHEYVKRGGCNSFHTKRVICYPFSIWTEKDIWDYKRLFNIPFCSLYEEHNFERSGCAICGFGCHRCREKSRFDYVYNTYPKLYHKMMNYTNNGVTYKEALLKVGAKLPDAGQLKLAI